jgi:glycosyltransferase involved in cell wall biosynthesis
VIVEEHPLTHAAGSIEVYDRAARDLGERMRRREIDVVYANTLESFLAIEAAKQAGIPSLWNVHESEPWQTYFIRFGDPIAACALKCFEHPYRTVFVSDATRDLFNPLNNRLNFSVIHNGLDTGRIDTLVAGRSRQQAREQLGVQTDELVILLLGTVCERKGQLDLPLALAQVPTSWHEKLRVFIVGDRPSPYSDRVHTSVAELPEKLRERVHLVEEIHDTALYYLAADVFVCTSRVESFPRVITEAMYFGLPVVTTPVFGIREQVTPGINGEFYDPAQPDKLAAALMKLLSDPDLRALEGHNARYVLQKLNSFTDMNDAYTRLFREAVGTGVAL